MPARAAASPMTGLISLEEAYDRALETDQTIRIAYWEVRKANLLPWSAAARLAPRIFASGGYSRSESIRSSRFSDLNGDSVAFTSRNETGAAQFGVTFEQPLIDFTVFPGWRSGKLTQAITRLQHQFTVRGTLFGVADAYYEVLKQQRLAI